MKAPVFVFCADGEMLVFATADRVLSYVESPDVEAGEYPFVFDSEGLRFKLGVEEPSRRQKGLLLTSIELTPVLLTPMEAQPSGSEELREMLAERLRDTNSEASLNELVARAAEELPSR